MGSTQTGMIGCWRNNSLSIEGVHVLVALRSHGAMTIGAIAHLRGVSLPNASSIVDRLEERGFVERVRDLNDRRVVSVQLATGGEALLTQAEAARHKMFVRVLEALTPAQRTEYEHGLRMFLETHHRLAEEGAFDDLFADETAPGPSQ